MDNDTSPMNRSLSGVDRLARGLGWLSIGLGFYKLLAPRKLTHALSMEGSELMVRACGARGIACGIGALSDNPTPALWTRVGGDMLDFAALTFVLRDDHNPKKENVGLALAAVGALAALDLYCARGLSQRHAYQAGPVPDYSDRSGFSRPVEEMRGAASGFDVPADMKADLPSPAGSSESRTQPPTAPIN